MLDLRKSGFEVVGKKEGFETISLEIDNLLEDNHHNNHATDLEDNLIFSDPASTVEDDDPVQDFNQELEWAPDRERKMSYECFDFPSEHESFDEPLQERYLLPPKNKSEFSQGNSNNTNPVKHAIPSIEQKLRQAALNNKHSGIEAEKLLTNFDHMKYVITPPAVTPTPTITVIETGRKWSRKPHSYDLEDGTNSNSSSKVTASSKSPTSVIDKTIACSVTKTISRNLDPVVNHIPRKIGIYSPEARKERITRFHVKRKRRIWKKCIKYDCRKKLADDRPRVKGRFVRRTEMDDFNDLLEVDDLKPEDLILEEDEENVSHAKAILELSSCRERKVVRQTLPV